MRNGLGKLVLDDDEGRSYYTRKTVAWYPAREAFISTSTDEIHVRDRDGALVNAMAG